MKKSQMYKKVNRKKRLFNHVNRNVVYPIIHQFHPSFNPNLDEEGHNNAVEIIELNSDDVSENEQQKNANHDICQVHQDDYKVNRTARDKRRHDIENTDIENFKASIYNDQYLNQFCTDFYGIDCYDRGERIPAINNPHSEFLTILNNHKNSDTSSDSNLYDDIEVIQCENTIQNDYWNSNNDCYDNINNMSYDIDDNTEKRTIWIYALKNKRYMSENDFDLINIPSKESTSTTDEEEQSIASPIIRRIATPIPNYMPRMLFPLSPTLPTVTEVTEPNKHASNDSDISTKSEDNTTILQKPVNGWFETGTTKTQNDKQNLDNIEITYENKCQALSPRERRRIRQAKTNEQSTHNSKKKPETFSYCEPTINIRDSELSPRLNIESFEKEIDIIDNNKDDKVESENNKKSDSTAIEMDCAPDEYLCNMQKPQIKLSTEINKLKKDITEPIEKLDGNWIGQSLPKDDELLEVYDYVMDPEDTNAASQKSGEPIIESASDRLFIRNMSLLKPAEWTQYLPLTGSVPSLHLSISVDTDINNEKKSWFKRLLQFVRCCK